MSQYHRVHDGLRLTGYSFRNQRYRYTEWREITGATMKGDGPVHARELYDYEVDPQETKNMIENPAYETVLLGIQSQAAEVLAHYGIECH